MPNASQYNSPVHAYRVLEFDAVRQRLADSCENDAAREAALVLEPSFDPDEVRRRQAETAEGYALLGEESLPSLARVHDLSHDLNVAAKGAVLGGEVLYRVGDSLTVMRQFLALVRPKQGELPHLWAHAQYLPEQKTLEALLLESFDPDGLIRDDASVELSRLRKQKRSAASRVQERIQSYISGRSRDLLSDPIYTQRDGRYVIPLKAEHRGKIKGIVHDTSATGQTLFIEPHDVIEASNLLREAEVAERAEEQRILKDLSSRVGKEATPIRQGTECSEVLDLILAKARLGYATEAIAPIPTDAATFYIRDGKHPLLDPAIAVPVTIGLDAQSTGVLITGPNTGGKTVTIKTVGLYVLMNQCGMMVPAREARLGLFSHVYADIGDEQSLQQSLSTFSGHIRTISNALNKLMPGALVLLDEVGAGTDPAEGAALAKAILLDIQLKKAKVVASTHYGELKVFAYNTPGFHNAAMEFDTQTLRPTYRLMMGAAGTSHALRIAERYGMPKAVIEKAREEAGEQQQDLNRMFERLETAQKLARTAQSEADRLASELKKVEVESRKALAEAQEIRRTAKARAAETLEESLREIRLEAQDIFESIKRNPTPEGLDNARKRLRDLDQKGQHKLGHMRPKEKPREAPAQLSKGMSVRVQGYTQTGTLLEDPRGNKVQVQLGPLKMSVATNLLTVVSEAPLTAAAKPRANLGLAKQSTIGMEVNLIQMRAEDAEQKLLKFLDDAVLAHMPWVRIVHGKGEGVLRALTRDIVKSHGGVSSFREAEPSEGGAGVTIAYL